jgi:uncharacterized protein involved in copper resistance
MINLRQLSPLLLTLALGSTPLLAQPAPQTKAAEPTTRTADKSAPVQKAPAVQQPAQKSTPPSTGKDSPFDYRSSEEISEDLPVSFPVDI